MRAELKKLTSNTIAQILDALHDHNGVAVRETLLQILWDRHALSGQDDQFGNADGSWASSVIQVANPLDYEAPPIEHKVTNFCAQADNPFDKKHQVKRTLIWESAPIEQSARGYYCIDAVECTCGRRSDLDGSKRLLFKRRMLTPTASVWPTVIVDGEPYHQVCKFATHADDPDHCPNSSGTQCICGGYLGSSNQMGKSDQLLLAT